jgi:AraC-like DNA-binding protein
MVTPHQLSEILNERLNMNFSSYLNGFRVREAERLLVKRGDRSIIEIAFEVGFNSKASFNNHFLKQTGLTPSEYRKRHGAVSA